MLGGEHEGRTRLEERRSDLCQNCVAREGGCPEAPFVGGRERSEYHRTQASGGASGSGVDEANAELRNLRHWRTRRQAGRRASCALHEDEDEAWTDMPVVSLTRSTISYRATANDTARR